MNGGHFTKPPFPPEMCERQMVASKNFMFSEGKPSRRKSRTKARRHEEENCESRAGRVLLLFPEKTVLPSFAPSRLRVRQNVFSNPFF